VAAGAPLLELNPDIIIAQLAQYKAALNLSKLAFDRAVKLYNTRTISKAEFDQAQADLSAGQARVDAANAQLRQARIIAPFAGRLGLSLVSIGDYVSAGQSIVNLESLDPINVDFSIPETYMGRVAVGQDIELRSGAFSSQVFYGKVDAIESQINPGNRSLLLRASVPNKEHKLLPGGFVDVKLYTNEASQQVISVPQVAVLYAPDGNYVYKIVNNSAVKTLVTLGSSDAQNVIIKEGLKPGDDIITAGQQKVQDGARVAVVPNKS
jgi:membrane fusion protein (multidrug efflux system)